jgi:hypothetical protein
VAVLEAGGVLSVEVERGLVLLAAGASEFDAGEFLGGAHWSSLVSGPGEHALGFAPCVFGKKIETGGPW